MSRPPETAFAETLRALWRALHRAWVFSRATVLIVAVLVVALIAMRVALPYILRHAINARLAKIPAYEGRVESVDVAVWRGAYVLDGVRIAKRGANGAEPFFAAREIDFSLAWRELFHRKFVSDIVADEAELNFVKGPSPAQSQLKADRRWQSVIQDIFPVDITHLQIENSRLHYLDKTADPVVDLYVDHMKLLATGLQNRPADVGEEFPAALVVEGDSIGHGRLFISGRGGTARGQSAFRTVDASRKSFIAGAQSIFARVWQRRCEVGGFSALRRGGRAQRPVRRLRETVFHAGRVHRLRHERKNRGAENLAARGERTGEAV